MAVDSKDKETRQQKLDRSYTPKKSLAENNQTIYGLDLLEDVILKKQVSKCYISKTYNH